MELQRPEKWDMLSLAFWSYSPHTLRHLPQPVPKDVPAHLDPNIFTFEDAFEDLLTLSQGQQLPDINLKHDQRNLLRRMFPGGEPADFWLQRLRSQGLVGNTITIPSMTFQLPGWMTDDFDREPSQPTSELAKSERSTDPEASSKHPWDRLMDDLGLSFGHPSRRSQSESDERVDSEKRQPDHFEDLFSAIESAVVEGQNSWNTFVKTLTEERNSPAEEQPKRLEPSPGTKEVVDREEHVDRFGYLHSKVTIRTLDAEGNQIGSETHYTMRPANKESADQEQATQHPPEYNNDGRPTKRIGWFWK
ncbi:hypothetical protein HJFPF1_11764 [Paramyrothecium foliicola]|nr:hypothetical protein HJFPF1_11764 [Paramyrothecium foliicola]